MSSSKAWVVAAFGLGRPNSNVIYSYCVILRCRLQLKAKGQLPAAAPAEEEKKEEEPSFKAFGGKGHSLKG